MIQKLKFAAEQSFGVDLIIDRSTEPDATFLGCSGLSCNQDVIEICEVTPLGWGRENKSKGLIQRTKLPGSVKYGNILLLRGTSYSKTFWEWFNSVQEGQWSARRREMSIIIYVDDPDRRRVGQLDLSGAWPASYKPGNFNSRSNDSLIENLEVAFESISVSGP